MHIILLKYPHIHIAFLKIPQLWRSGFSRVYSNSCCSCSFEPEIIKDGQSSHKMYRYNILNFQESTTILNACTKMSGNLLKAPGISWISGGFRCRSSGETARLVVKGDSLPVGLGARHEHSEQLRVLAHLATRPKRFGPQQLGLQSMHIRQTWLSPLRQWFRWNGLAHLLLLRAGSPVLEPRRGVDSSHQPQTGRAAQCWLRCGHRWPSVSGWEAKGVSHNPSCSQNGDLGDVKQGMVWGCKLLSSGSDLVL